MTLEELDKVDTDVMAENFDKVKDQSDWRNPIDVTLDVTEEEARKIIKAIWWYVGVGEMFPVPNGYRFVSVGYRMGPCGP